MKRMNQKNRLSPWVGGLAVLGVAAVAPAARGAIVISEVVYNEVGSDTTGEWAEIYNNGPSAADVSNFKFGDEETKGGDSESGGMWKFPAGTTLAPGQIVTITVSAARFNTVYGFKPSFELATANDDPAVPNMEPYLAWLDTAEPNNMSNSNDQAILLDGSDAIADMVSWGNTTAFDPGLNATVADGQSYYRTDPSTDTNTAADWALTPTPTLSTPGVIPAATPEPSGLGLLAVAGVGLLRRRRGHI